MSEFKTDFERLLELQWKALWAWPGAIVGFWARVLSDRSGNWLPLRRMEEH